MSTPTTPALPRTIFTLRDTAKGQKEENTTSEQIYHKAFVLLGYKKGFC